MCVGYIKVTTQLKLINKSNALTHTMEVEAAALVATMSMINYYMQFKTKENNKKKKMVDDTNTSSNLVSENLRS